MSVCINDVNFMMKLAVSEIYIVLNSKKVDELEKYIMKNNKGNKMHNKASKKLNNVIENEKVVIENTKNKKDENSNTELKINFWRNS